jgi:methylated-DNA-[protein]-cysteine S-methyltransferase
MNNKILRNPKYIASYETALGEFIITSDGEYINSIRFAQMLPKQTDFTPCPLTDTAAVQLREYFSGQRKDFDVPINPYGTEFQRLIWNYLRTIPYGETLSYKQVACGVNKPTASREVGMANNKNPLMIIVPCHRVVGSNGELVGYAGGLELKKQLLEIERRFK